MSQIVFNWTYTSTPQVEWNISTSEYIRNNGTVFAHVFFVPCQTGTVFEFFGINTAVTDHLLSICYYASDVFQASIQGDNIVYKRFDVIKHKLKKKKVILKRLLESKQDSIDLVSNVTLDTNLSAVNAVNVSSHDDEDRIVAYWTPTLGTSSPNF